MLDRQIAQKEQEKKYWNNDQYEKWEKMKMNREGHREGKGMQRIKKERRQIKHPPIKFGS